MAATKQMTGRMLTLGIPLAIGFVSQMAISFTDAALIARQGPAELAGVTLALSVFGVVMLLGLGMVTAVSPKLAACYRSGNMADTRSWYMQGGWLATFAGLVGIGILLNTRNILVLIGQAPALADIAQQYNNGAALGLPFFLLYVNTRSLMSAVGQPKALTWIMLAAVPFNLVVGYLAIFGIGTVPGFGVLGAGLSSTLVRILIVMATFAVVYRGRAFKDLAIRNATPDLRLPMLIELVRVGLPIGVRILLGEGILPVLAFFVARYGADATAAHAVGLRLESLIAVCALGFSSAATTVAAWARTDRDWRALRDLRSVLLLIGAVYAVALSLIVAATFSFIVRVVFSLHEPSTEATLVTLLPLVIGYFVIDTFGIIFNGYLVGLLDTLIPTVVVMVSYWIVGLGFGVLLAGHTPLGFYGLWWGMVISGGLIALFNFSRSAHHIRVLKKMAEAPV